MEKFKVTDLKPGEKLLVKTETGSIYHLLAETALEAISGTGNSFKGLRATRESDHQIQGHPEHIENEPAVLIIRPGQSDGTLQTGDFMDLIWDRDHPESKSDWDIQFGPRFHDLYTSRVADIEFVPVEK